MALYELIHSAGSQPEAVQSSLVVTCTAFPRTLGVAVDFCSLNEHFNRVRERAKRNLQRVLSIKRGLWGCLCTDMPLK